MEPVDSFSRISRTSNPDDGIESTMQSYVMTVESTHEFVLQALSLQNMHDDQPGQTHEL